MAVIFKTLSATLAANVNEVTFTDSLINSNSVIEVYYNSNDVYTVETWQDGTTIGIVTSDHNFAVGVKVTINNATSFAPYDDTSLVNQINGLSDDITALDGRLDTAEDDIDNLENDVESLSTSKQDVLTAGTGISIDNNIISATISNTYSETERVVGTWIDGKPVYEKTILHTGTFTGNNSPQPFAHGISNVNRFISITGFIYDAHNENPSWMPIPRVYSSNYFGISHIDNTYYYIYIPVAFETRLRNSHITIRYMKSTD